MRILVAEAPQALAEAAAEMFVAAAYEAVQARGRFLVALSGGSTPRPLYELLASSSFDARAPWQSTYILFGDERCVAPADARSNYGLVERTGLLRRRLGRVCRIRGELGGEIAAALAVRELRALAGGATLSHPGLRAQAAGAPRLDLALLGVGADGHTASLFPGSEAVDESVRPAMPVQGPDGLDRVTLTVPVFAAARRLLFLATGREKAHAVAAAAVPRQPSETDASSAVSPAALVARTAERRGCVVEWLLDRAAASHL